MRLIDADELIRILWEWEKEYKNNKTESGDSIAIGIRCGIAMVEQAKTVKADTPQTERSE